MMTEEQKENTASKVDNFFQKVVAKGFVTVAVLTLVFVTIINQVIILSQRSEDRRRSQADSALIHDLQTQLGCSRILSSEADLQLAQKSIALAKIIAYTIETPREKQDAGLLLTYASDLRKAAEGLEKAANARKNYNLGDPCPRLN